MMGNSCSIDLTAPKIFYLLKLNTGNVVTVRVYFRPLKKGVVLPLAIVKKG